MSVRKRTIEKLKYGVKNKEFACYNKNVDDCLYYHGETKTKCAVGYIVPESKLFKYQNKHGNVKELFDDRRSSSIRSQLYAISNKVSYMGLKFEELDDIQDLHDSIIHSDSKSERKEITKKFEDYIKGLK
jgi:hypothetical protein